MAAIAVFIALGGGAYAASGLPGLRAGKGAKSLWAVVSANGNLVRRSRAVSAKHLFTPDVQGSYQVVFNRKVTNCALIATLGRTNSAPLNPEAGEIGVAYRNKTPKGVYVKTRDSGGSDADRSFHLAVIC